MTRLAWLTDIHLDHLTPRPKVRHAFAEMVAEDSDCCVITGDISSYVEARLLPEFAKHYGKPVYFVLGNHDYWGAGFVDTHAQLRRLEDATENLHWLSECSPIDIAPGVQLTGQDGWYDAEYGSWRDSSFHMVDWNAIRDFYGMKVVDIVAKCRRHAGFQARAARCQLDTTTAPTVLFATHVPPYQQSAMHEGKPSDRTSMPWYTSKAMGDTLDAWASANPGRQLTTLCGHVHSASEYQAADNHLVLCGAAEYGAPVVQRVFDL